MGKGLKRCGKDIGYKERVWFVSSGDGMRGNLLWWI